MILEDGKIVGVGILVIQDNKLLLGRRTDGQGWSACGGKVEPGETLAESAVREANEEFSITVREADLTFLGYSFHRVYIHGVLSDVIGYTYFCNKFDGVPIPKLDEIMELTWFDINELTDVDLFRSTQDSLYLYKNYTKLQ